MLSFLLCPITWGQYLMMSFLLIMTGFIINVGAYNSEVYHNEDMSVVVSVNRNLNDNQLELNIGTNSSEEVIVNDIKLNNESLVKKDYGYSAVVGENGNYKFVVELTRSILIQEENEEVKTIERQETFDFSVEVNEIQISEDNLQENTQVNNEDNVEKTNEVETEEQAPVEETQSNDQTIKGITVTIQANGSKILSSIPNIEDLKLFISENEYVSVDNKSGVISIKQKQASDVVKRFSRSTRASNNVTTGNKVVQPGDTITVTWRENRSYYWQLWGGISELFVNGNRAYCIEPSVFDSVATPNASSTSLNSMNGVLVHPDGRLAFTPTQTQKANLELISNYGYKYPGHQTAKYEWATKKLIWNEMGWDVTGGPNVDSEMAEIRALIASHQTRPTWHNQIKKVKIGEVVDLSQNGLDKFAINNNLTSGLEVVEFSGNTLKVKVTSKNASLGLTKRGGSEQGTSYVYSDGRSQKVASLRLIDPVMATIDFEAKTGNLEITKKGTDGNFYAGVEFELSNDKTTILGTYTTGTNGKVTITDLDEGTYFVREKSVPTPLVIDTSWKSIIIVSGQTTPFEAVNELAKGKIQITKKDNYGMNLDSVVFEVRNSSNVLVDTVTTNASGVATTKDLSLGSYTVVEKSTKPGLVLYTTSHTVTLNYKDQTTAIVTVNISLTNKYQRANLTLTKVENNWDSLQSQNNGKSLANAEITLFATNEIKEGNKVIYTANQKITVGTTNAEGKVSFNNLPAGEYYAKETKAPEGYVLFAGQWNISIKNGNATSEIITVGQTVTNQVIYGKAQLIKTDGFNKLLSGAKFNVYTVDGKEILKGLVSNDKGMVLTSELRYGDFYFQKVEAPEGYWLSSEKIPFTISEHQETVFVTTSNKLIEAKLLVNKVDSEDQLPLAGAKFKILDIKTNEFISVKYQQGTQVVTKDTWVTDENGQFLLEAFIPYGHYQLVEIEAPEGYNISSPVDFTIDENQDYQELEIIGTVLETTVPNRPIRSDISIVKVDAKTGQRLPNFTFKLTYLSDMSEMEITTDENGVATFEKIKYGNYMVEEVNVSGAYVIDREPQIISIQKDGITYEVVFRNHLVKGRLEGLKVDYKDQSPIEGAVYGLFTLEDKLVYSATTDIDGKFVFEDITLGDYYVQEIESPEGYRLDETKYEVSFVYENQDTAIINVSLTVEELRMPVIGTAASFVERDKAQPNIVTLQDEVRYTDLIIGKEYTVNGVLMDKATGEALLIDGRNVTGYTTFTPTESDGTVVVNFTFDASKLETETIVVFEELYDGNRLIAFHTDINDLEQTVEVLTIRVTKIDSLTKKALPSAEFTRWDDKGNVVQVVKSNEEGIAEFKLFEGEYIKIKETNAPEGYLLSEEVIEVIGAKEIEGNLYEIEYPNTPKPAISLPGTGLADTLNLVPLIFVLLGLLLIFIKKNDNSLQIVSSDSSINDYRLSKSLNEFRVSNRKDKMTLSKRKHKGSLSNINATKLIRRSKE